MLGLQIATPTKKVRMDTVMIEATIEHFVEGKSATEIIKLSEPYVFTIGVVEYRTKFEEATFKKFKSKWADTIELTITQLDKHGATLINSELTDVSVPVRKILYPHA